MKIWVVSMECAGIAEAGGVKNVSFSLCKEFSDLKNNLQYSEDGFQLFLKITDEINQKNRKNAQETDSIFEPKKPIITYIILGIIGIIFLLSFIINPNQLVYYLGVNGYFIRSGEIYRLLTGAFLHIDVIHFITNAYSLYIVGKLVESYFGKKKFALIYLISAITANLLSISMNDGFSIGASGAIFGLFGSLVYFGYHYRVYFGNVLLRQILPIIIINLFIGFTIPGIDNFAHIGGLIGGFLVSKAVGVNSRDKKSDKVNGIILTTIYVVFLIILGIFMR